MSSMVEPPVHNATAEPDLIMEVMASLGAVVRWSGTGFYQQIAARSGLHFDRSIVTLLAVFREGMELRQSQLADLVGVERSTLSRQVAGAMKLGLVTSRQDTADKRAILLKLTPAGIAARRQVSAAWYDLISDFTDEWPAQDQRTLADLLARLVDGIQRTYDQASSTSPAFQYVFLNEVEGVPAQD